MSAIKQCKNNQKVIAHFYQNSIIFGIPFRELLFGEHALNRKKDCYRDGYCLPEPFTRKADKIFKHPDFNYGPSPNDIGRTLILSARSIRALICLAF